MDYGINPTFSDDDESVEYPEYPPPPPPPLRLEDQRRNRYSDDLENNGYSDAVPILDDLQMEENGENGNAFEHTLSEHEYNAEPYAEEYGSVEDSGSESQGKKRQPLKRKTLLGVLALVLMVVVGSLAIATATKKRKANQKSSANIAESNSAIVAPVETPSKAPTAPPTKSPTSAPTKDSEPSMCKSIAEIACSTSGLETLCSLIDDACTTSGLESVCETIGKSDGKGPFTIFAPNNSAFEMVPAAIMDAIEDTAVLNNVLLYHVVDGKVLKDDLVCDAKVTMANMEYTTTKCENDYFFQVGAGNSADALPKIVEADIVACDGIVHIIDAVILPGAKSPVEPPSMDPDHMYPTGDHMYPTSDHSSPYYPEDGMCRDEIHVSKQCYTFGESIEITYNICHPGEQNWFGIFNKGSCDRNGRMRRKPFYWELPCGGHGESCANPQGSGTVTVSANIGAGRYQLYSVSNMSRPWMSTTSSKSFIVAKRCPPYY